MVRVIGLGIPAGTEKDMLVQFGVFELEIDGSFTDSLKAGKNAAGAKGAF